MTSALLNLLGTALGIFLVLGGWILFLQMIRRRSGCPNLDKDVLDFMAHGCGGCTGSGLCHGRPPEPSKRTTS